MKLLLDTHALIWWLSNDACLGQSARNLIVDPGNDVLISAVSLWEIAVKLKIGKLEADIEEIDHAIVRDGFQRLGIHVAHLKTLSDLPQHRDHRDPFDQLLIAQAISGEATFISEDRHTSRYPVRFVTCSEPPPPR